ncbi:hypothetical protein DYB37_009328 [Aphanomyces astaci]|uniref:B box-type domain-containing protein n=3 Tax=Aphanomyces astaci TaxID=112090 RepID=A0A3R7B7J6_APHAT|nr:hypothetical protein DYB35_010505 [Aphanomyces astaci]RHZ20818.1 hypothetical protein DYB37_009328 [Aphanomyces astaci]
MLDDDVRENVEHALRRIERQHARAEKKEQDARKAYLLREAARRSLELRRCSEMAVEDKWSQLAAVQRQIEEKREMELRRKAEGDKLLVLLATARKTAKSAGAALSTPGLRGLERLAELTARVVAVEEDTVVKQAEITAKLRLRYNVKRAQRMIGNYAEHHAVDLMNAAILGRKWDAMLHLVAVGGLSPDFETVEGGFTPVIMALSWRKPSVARRLLDAGASIDVESAHGKTGLLAAILADDVDGVRLCIARGADLARESPKTGVTPLLLAVDKGRTKLVRVLLEAHVDPNAFNSHGISPLIQATLSQQTDVTKLLFHHGATLSARGKDDRTCVEWARRCMFHGFADALETLNFEVGGARDEEDDHRDVLESSVEDIGLVIRQVERGEISPNAETAAGWTPLLVACARGALSHVQTLLALGSIAWHQNRRGRTPLMAACERGAADMMTCLVNAGASFAVVDDSGADAFHALVEFPELVQQWTAVRNQFRPTVPLGVPTRASGIGRPAVAHAVPMLQTTIPDTSGIAECPPRPSPPPSSSSSSCPENHDDSLNDIMEDDTNRRTKWQLQRTHLRRDRIAKLVPFYEEREKICQAQQKGRRSAVSVPLRDANAIPPPPAQLCDNCLHVRATAVCVECIMAFCDRCLMERHYGPTYHHHVTAPLDKAAAVGVHLRRPDGPEMHLRANVQRCKVALRGIAHMMKPTNTHQSNQNPTSDGEEEEEDGDIRARKQAEKRQVDAKRRDNIMDENMRQCAGDRLFATPSELFLARNMMQREKYDKALALYAAAHAVQVDAFGALHPRVGHTLVEMAAAAQANGDKEAWTDGLLSALECFEVNYACDNVDVVATVRKVCDSWDARKKYREAMAFCRVTELVRRKALGGDHPLTTDAQDAAARFACKWETLQMFLEDPVGQQLEDRHTNAAYYADAALGRLPSQFHALLLSDPGGLALFTPFCNQRMHGANLAFWLAVNAFKAKCLQKHPTFHPRVAAKAIFKDFLKSQQVKCTTVAMRNRIRASLRSDASDPVDVFESAETLVFNSLYSSVFLAFLDTPEGTR